MAASELTHTASSRVESMVSLGMSFDAIPIHFINLSWNISRINQLLLQADARIPFTRRIVLTHVLPILIAFYTLAILVQLPSTRRIRFAIMAPTIATVWKVAAQYYIPPSPEDIYNSRNSHLVFGLCVILLRLIDFGTSSKVFQREQFSIIPPSPDTFSTQLKGAFLNSFDLVCNMRGIGWNWGRSLYVPPKGWSNQTPGAVALRYFVDMVKMHVFFDVLTFAIQTLVVAPLPGSVAHPMGASIYDPSLSFPLYHIKAFVISAITLCWTYGSMRTVYSTAACVGIVVLRQSPAQWPPIFQDPWLSENLRSFWSVRWHQTFKRVLVVSGAKPASWIFGRLGGVFGAFFISGVMHDATVWGFGLGAEPGSVTMFFVMSGLGYVLERIWQIATGFKVRGWAGWAWTMGWTVAWLQPLVDAWARRGYILEPMLPEEWRPSLFLAGIVRNLMA